VRRRNFIATIDGVAEARAQRSRRVRRVGVTGNVPYARAQLSWFVFGGCLFLLVLLSLGCVACAQVSPGKVLDEAAAPGTNYEKAEFRLWYPDKARFVHAVVVLVPGANADGRPDVNDRFWQAFASRNEIALIGCHFTDKPHEESFIENYANAAQGSGQALLDALRAFSSRSDHSELANAPLLLWGMSAGGEFNYEFTAWKPERVVAFVVNKGGIYFSALLPAAARRVPALLFVGEEDLESRKSIIAGLFALNRRAGALWALAEEAKVGHVIGRSQEMAAIFFDAVLSLRVGSGGSAASFAPLTQLEERSGIVGELVQGGLRAPSDDPAPTDLTAWFPTERVARAWQALRRTEPFER
jgi:dienelactone hydrolase